MAVTLKEVEAIPARWPMAKADLSPAARVLDYIALWQRLEAYCRVRWTAREVVWTVEGGGEWEAPLSPATVETVEVWNGQEWTDCTPMASPLGGLELAEASTYRITAVVGGGELPGPVSEAYRRLAEYLADQSGRAGVSSYSVNMGGAIEESYDRNPAWLARALDYSGAADLLRPYKRRM